MWSWRPATLLDFPPGEVLAGANRGPVGGSRRGWWKKGSEHEIENQWSLVRSHGLEETLGPKHIPAAIGGLRKEKAVGSDLNRYFSQMGARVKVLEGLAPVRDWRMARTPEDAQRISLDIGRDKRGEFFEIRTVPGSEQDIVVLNVQPREKHLLLLSRQFGEQGQVLGEAEVPLRTRRATLVRSSDSRK